MQFFKEWISDAVVNSVDQKPQWSLGDTLPGSREHSTQYTGHCTYSSGPMAPCDINHPLVKSDIVSIYLKCKTCSPADILPTCHNHCWLLLNLTCHQWPRRDALFLIIIWSPIICDYSTAQSWLVSCVQRHFPRGETWLGLVEEPQNIRPQWGQLLVGANTAWI